MALFFHYIYNMVAGTFSDSEYARDHAKRNAVIQILIATIAFILMMRVFPAGMVQSHTLSEQMAYDKPTKAGATGDPFTASDKKLQMVYFMKEHLYQITLYMQCDIPTDTSDAGSVMFRLYDETFSCIYEEGVDNRKIAKDGCLTATPDLDVEEGKAYYYEILVDEESSAAYMLPVADRTALAQQENSVLYIDGIYNDAVCLVADFDYSHPLTAAGIIGYYLLIMVVGAGVYLLALLLVWLYDGWLLQDPRRIGQYVRIGVAVVSFFVSAALLVYTVVLNCFGGEVWDRLFFAVGIIAAQVWVIGFLWHGTRVIRPKKYAKMTAGSIMGLTWRNYIQTVSFGLLFYALCQYANADRNYYQYTNTRWMLIFLAIALLMNYKEKLFVNKFSAIWLALGFVGSLFYCRTVRTDKNELVLARLTCGVVVSWGLLILNILLWLVRTGRVPVRKPGTRIAGWLAGQKQQAVYIILWVLFSLLMYVNRYEKVWVFTATLPFLASLFTINTFAATCRFLKNFCNGIFCSFALVTVFCLAHRPHHYWMLYRYGGIFHTVACTGMYLAVVFGAALAKLYGKIKTRKNMLLFGLPEYFLAACTIGFILLTMSRTAFLTTAVATASIVVLAAVVYRKGVGRVLSELGVLMVICLVSFPMVYTTVRMVPAVVNDPVRYDIEHQDRSFMIYEGDPIDSDKYMTVRRFFTTLFGRFQASEQESGDAGTGDTQGPGWQVVGELAYAGDGLTDIDMRQFSVNAPLGGFWATGDAQAENASGEEEKNDISNGRFEIFSDYIKAIGFNGHPKMGPIDKLGYEYSHAHNSYLQVAYNFGLIAGIVFLVLCALTLWRSIRFALDHGNKYSIAFVPFSLVIVFGFISLTEWAYHPCIPAGFSFMLMQMVLMRTDTQKR